MGKAYRIGAEDSAHFIPFRAFIWTPSEFLGQTSSEQVHTLLDFSSTDFLSSQAANEERSRCGEWLATIPILQHELADWNGIWWIKRQLWRP